MQRMIAAGCNNGSHDIEMIIWKKMTMLALMGGLVEFVSSDQHFTICAKEAVTSRAKAKPIRDGMWTHRTLSLLSLVSRDVFLTKCHWMWRISPLALWKFEVGCIKNLSWPVVWYMTWAVRVGPFYGIIVALHGQNSPCSGVMQTELLMFWEMPSMPLDFPGPKHGSNCFHQNPVVFARPGLTMGLKKNENDGPVCRLSHMNRDKWEKEWKIRSPNLKDITISFPESGIVFWGAQQIFGEVWHLETPLLVVFAWICPKVLLWRVAWQALLKRLFATPRSLSRHSCSYSPKQILRLGFGWVEWIGLEWWKHHKLIKIYTDISSAS